MTSTKQIELLLKSDDGRLLIEYLHSIADFRIDRNNLNPLQTVYKEAQRNLVKHLENLRDGKLNQTRVTTIDPMKL
jgi:hypothetical protein